MSGPQSEKAEITRRLCASISKTIHDYALEHPDTMLEVADVREILVKIIDYIDISDITGFTRWE